MMTPTEQALDALTEIDARLKTCAAEHIDSADCYDSFYQEIVREAIAALEAQAQVTDERPTAIGKIDKALQVVADLCDGKQRWTMRIPAEPDSDPDLVIAGALASARALLAAQPEQQAKANELTRATQAAFNHGLAVGSAINEDSAQPEQARPSEAWLPTAENVNKLPDGLRQYVHALEALCDPSGIVRENTMLKDCNTGLQKMFRSAEEREANAQWRYRGYKNEPLPEGATEAMRAAWQEGRDAQEPRAAKPLQAQPGALDADYAELYQMLRRGQQWSVVNGIGDVLRGEELDAAIRAAITKTRGDHE